MTMVHLKMVYRERNVGQGCVVVGLLSCSRCFVHAHPADAQPASLPTFLPVAAPASAVGFCLPYCKPIAFSDA